MEPFVSSVLFAKVTPGVATLDNLPFVRSLFINYIRAVEKMQHHFNIAPIHRRAVADATALAQVMRGKAESVNRQASTALAERVKVNKEKLVSIVKTVEFCARQWIALRGHRDDHFDPKKSYDERDGNFSNLLRFRIDAGDTVLKQHFDSAAGNARYVSKTVQNELLDVCRDQLRDKIVASANSAALFTVMADEASDVSNKEQLAICIRYLSETDEVSEKFLGFVECNTGVSGEALAEKIIIALKAWKLDVMKLRGQAHDGAGAMAGATKGATSRIAENYPLAMFSHCAAHRLNLCVVKSCSIPSVSNMMCTADKVVRFFNNSPKRQSELEKTIAHCYSAEKRTRLKELCRTRWVERHDAFQVFEELFLAITTTLEAIASRGGSSWNRQSRADAESFLLAISRFEFIMSLVVCRHVLSYTKQLSVCLQGRYMDVASAYGQVDHVIAKLEGLRTDVTTISDKLLDSASKIAETIGVEVSKPRTTGRQQHRANVPADSPAKYYERCLTIPMLDHLLAEMKTRFVFFLVSQLYALFPGICLEY